MKRILYDMGPLTFVRWPLWRDLKVLKHPFGPGFKLRRVPPPKNKKKQKIIYAP